MRNATAGFASLAALLAALAVGPTADAAGARHVIYLHGRIIQQTQSARPRHPRFGYYELDEILGAFRDRGFEVRGEIRPKSASLSDSADHVVEQVRQLLESGVAPDRISVVGGSMGGAIALLASARLQNPDVRFSVLGPCLSRSIPALKASEGKAPAGHVLSIREKSDDFSEPCPSWKEDQAKLVTSEMLLETGLAHGFLYAPLPEWMGPVVEWAGGQGAGPE